MRRWACGGECLASGAKRREFDAGAARVAGDAGVAAATDAPRDPPSHKPPTKYNSAIMRLFRDLGTFPRVRQLMLNGLFIYSPLAHPPFSAIKNEIAQVEKVD